MHIEISAQTTIRRPAWEVREQLRDVTYHSGHRVHSRVRMKVVERRAGRCRYLLTTTAGPFAFEHLVVLADADDGGLVNTFVGGALKGAFLDYRFDWVGPEETTVTATLVAPRRGALRWFGALTRRHAARHLHTLLAEDRADLEARVDARADAHP